MSNEGENRIPPGERAGNKWVMTTVGVLILAVVYGAVNQWAGARGVTAWDPKQVFMLADGRSLDRLIPVVPSSVHLYNTLFILYWLPALVLPPGERARRQLRLLMQTLIVVLGVACLFFLLLPAEIDMRDQVHAAFADSAVWSGHVLAFDAVHLLDTPFNSWPCLHIAQPILICGAVSFWHWKRFPIRITLLWVYCFFLGVSILTTKQHFIWDVATGAVLGFAALHWLRRRFQRMLKASTAGAVEADS